MVDDKDDMQSKLVGSTQDIKDRLRSFEALLKNIETLDDKKRALWLDIYENAVADRANAYMMFSTLVRITQDKTVEFAVHGKTISSYLERMAKANDQLIKLAELVANAERKAGGIDTNDVFDRINRGRS